MYHPRLKGGHYEIGLHFGKMLKKQHVDFYKLIDLNRFQKDFGAKSQKILSEVFPEVCDEIRGITDGLNFSYEEFASWLLCMGCCHDLHGCTTFCFTKNGNVIYGRNNDLPPFLKKASKSVLYKLDSGYSFIGNTSSMINFEEGLNEYGLAVAMEFIVPTFIVPGINSVFLVRYLLEKCATTKEAINALKSLPIASACSIILADKVGDMAVAECTPKNIFFREPASDDNFIVAANHFISREMTCYNACLIFSSDIRYQTAYDALKNVDYINGIEHAENILSGKHGFMCQYHRVLNFDTIWSSVFNISNGKIYRAEGNPSRIEFKEDNRTNKITFKRNYRSLRET
ncbi:MAG TPA: C45 family autoproteolytic acyltransferase/hydrolase [Desulfobacteraceae bacterium]|nr:C45 family autoproteolytic acyltransferase/hydrolase [Desulfobacteraceae bacterium]